jgi:hypothetical protein
VLEKNNMVTDHNEEDEHVSDSSQGNGDVDDRSSLFRNSGFF